MFPFPKSLENFVCFKSISVRYGDVNLTKWKNEKCHVLYRIRKSFGVTLTYPEEWRFETEYEMEKFILRYYLRRNYLCQCCRVKRRNIFPYIYTLSWVYSCMRNFKVIECNNLMYISLHGQEMNIDIFIHLYCILTKKLIAVNVASDIISHKGLISK